MKLTSQLQTESTKVNNNYNNNCRLKIYNYNTVPSGSIELIKPTKFQNNWNILTVFKNTIIITNIRLLMISFFIYL